MHRRWGQPRARRASLRQIFLSHNGAREVCRSPPIKQQYLYYLVAESYEASNDGSMVEGYSPEDFYAWALEPCPPHFESLAPVPKAESQDHSS